MCKFDTFFSHFFEDTDRVWNTGFQDIISIYQQCAGIWIHFGVCFESCVFIWEAHDPAVGMCSQNRYVKHLSGQYVGSSGASTDDSCTCTIDTGIRTLCTTQAEFHDSVPTGCIADSGCFGSNQTLMIDDIQDCGFYKLCLHDRSDYFDEWFSRKYDSSFRNCINISGKFKRSQIFQKIVFKDMKASEIFDIIVCKMKIFNIFDHLFQTCCDRKAATAWIDTIKHIKNYSLIGWVLKIAVHHG